MIHKKVVSQCVSSDYCCGWNDAVDALVRCKDCAHSRLKDGAYSCAKSLVFPVVNVPPEHYCADGIRKEDEQ